MASRNAHTRKRYILETVGSGVALLDYDRVGWLDIYLVNSPTYGAANGKEPAPKAEYCRFRGVVP